LWVRHGSSLAIGESESLVEVWAVLEASDVSSDFSEVLAIEVLLLGQLVVRGAVISNLWVWDTSGLSISEGESLIEVWAMRK
jgi:hypothetical protein